MERKRSRLAEQVLEVLRDEIVRGVLAPGEAVIEADLSARLNVSRTPVRAALAKLVQEGLVCVYSQRGSFVAPIRLDAVRGAQFIREHLECAVVAEAARRITPEAANRLADNLAAQDRAEARGDAEEFYRLDEAFHAALAEIGGHPEVWQIIQQAKLHMDRIRHLSMHDQEHLHLIISQHHALLDAVAAHEVRRAVGTMRGHLRLVLATIERLNLDALPPTDVWPPRRRTGAAKNAVPPTKARTGLPGLTAEQST